MEVMVSHTVDLETCTGVRIGGGLIATAKHCTDELEVGDTYAEHEIGFVSPDHDFSILKGDKEIDPVHLDDAVFGERVFVLGFPTQLENKSQLTITDGIFTGVTDGDMQRITNFCYYGNSGGGAWSASGGLLGVVVELRPTNATNGKKYPVPFPAHCFMVPSALLREALE